jgi:hypothetical protein
LEKKKRRALARPLKLYRVFMLTKKGDINIPKISGTPSGPLRGHFIILGILHYFGPKFAKIYN